MSSESELPDARAGQQHSNQATAARNETPLVHPSPEGSRVASTTAAATQAGPESNSHYFPDRYTDTPEDSREVSDEPHILEQLASQRVPMTQSQRIALFIYPAIVLVGQLCSLFDPDPSYFSGKRNLFNVYFVKKAWLWTTIAYLLFVVKSIAQSQHNDKSALSSSGSVSPNQTAASATKYLGTPAQIAARYLAATLWWVLFAQWFFGFPLMDRVFILTGGSCIGLDDTSPSLSSAAKGVSSATCKKLGGTWSGGHDPSGHVFLLTHSSLFLWFEMLPYICTSSRKPLKWPQKTAIAILVLWSWMLLMTATHFHSFTEKVVGLAFGYVEIVAVYIFARDTALGEAIFG